MIPGREWSMATWWNHAVCLLLLLVPGRSAKGDLEEQLYEEAKLSKYMTWIGGGPHGDGKLLEDFLHNPTAPYMLVMFHVGSCHICKDALPKLEEMAKAWIKAEQPTVVGHIEVTGNQDYWKKYLGFTGFPNLLLWHRPEADFAKKAKSLFQFTNGIKDDSTSRVTVTKNESLLLAASRGANMASEKDERRLKGLGQPGTVEQVELTDYSARVAIDSMKPKTTWYPLEALMREDGSPVMEFQRPSAPVHYRPSSWGKKAMQDFTERMMRPAVMDLKDRKQLAKEMKEEQLPAIVLCADKIEDSPGFPGLAQKWQDKHRAYLATSPEACPVPSGGNRPQLVVFSASHHQWSSEPKAPHAVAVAGPDVVGKDQSELTAWFSTRRFPGIWNVSYENFHMLINSNRRFTLLAVDRRKKVEFRKVEQIMRDTAKPVASEAQGKVDIYPYNDDSFFWGAVDGSLNGLDQFGILRSSLPRVVVFEPDQRWVEDSEELTVWRLESDLKKLPDLVRYSNDGIRGFFMTRLYKPWKSLDRNAKVLGGTSARFFLLAILVGGIIMVLWKIGRGSLWLFKSLVAPDEAEPEKKNK